MKLPRKHEKIYMSPFFTHCLPNKENVSFLEINTFQTKAIIMLIKAGAAERNKAVSRFLLRIMLLRTNSSDPEFSTYQVLGWRTESKAKQDIR